MTRAVPFTIAGLVLLLLATVLPSRGRDVARARWMTPAVVAVVAVVLVLWWPALQHWLAVHTGTVNESGPYYGFWSGFGSDLSEFALVGALAGLLRKHNCHVRGCPRIGRHHVEGTQYVVCGHHSPTGAPTHQDVIDAHQEHLEGRADGS
jgi:hypothetical protein